MILPALLVMLSLAGVEPAHSQSATQQSSPPAQSQTQAQSQTLPAAKQDSVAESARKAREKKGKATATKVYTDDDLSGGKPGTISVVGQDSSSSGASVSAGDSEPRTQAANGTKSGQPDEAYWRGKARKLLDQIAAVDQQIKDLQEDIKKTGAVSVDPVSGLRQNVIYVDDKNARLKDLEQKKQNLQKQLEQLQEEGRKAGAPSGWFR
jgi:hypothetical protein